MVSSNPVISTFGDVVNSAGFLLITVDAIVCVFSYLDASVFSGKLYAAKTETLATATAVTNINTNFFIKKLLPFYTNQLLYTHFVLHSLIHITIYLYNDFVKPKRTTIFLDAKMIQKSAISYDTILFSDCVNIIASVYDYIILTV